MRRFENDTFESVFFKSVVVSAHALCQLSFLLHHSLYTGSTFFPNRHSTLLKHPRPKVNTFNLEAAEAAEETGGEVMNGVSCPNGSKLSKKMEWRGLG